MSAETCAICGVEADEHCSDCNQGYCEECWSRHHDDTPCESPCVHCPMCCEGDSDDAGACCGACGTPYRPCEVCDELVCDDCKPHGCTGCCEDDGEDDEP